MTRGSARTRASAGTGAALAVVVVLGASLAAPAGPARGAQPPARGAQPAARGAQPAELTVERVAGAGRVATAAAAARRLVDDGASQAVVASATGWADALAGTPLAVRRGAPMLLTGQRLPAPTRSVLATLATPSATVLGGVGAVPLAAQLDAAADDVAVRRIAGRTRTDTAALAARAAFDAPAGEAVVATSVAFPDALAAGTLAAVADAPVLLTGPERLDGDAEAAIAELEVESTTVVGGTASVGGDVADDLPDATRLAGEDRYATAARVARAVVARGGDPSTVVVATGRDYPDALAGAVLAGRGGHPLVLLDGRDAQGAQAAWAFLARHARHISRVVIMGGPAAVSDDVADRLAALDGGEDGDAGGAESGGGTADGTPRTATAGAAPQTATAAPTAKGGGDG